MPQHLSTSCPSWCTKPQPSHEFGTPLEAHAAWHSPGRFGVVDVGQYDDGHSGPGELSIIVRGADQYLEHLADWPAAAARLRAIAADLERAAAWLDDPTPATAPVCAGVGGGA